MKQEYIEKYVELYMKYENDKTIKFTKEELDFINKMNILITRDLETANMVEEMKKLSFEKNSAEIKQEREELLNNNSNEISELNLMNSVTELEDSTMSLDTPKQRIKTKESSKTGYVDILLLSLISGFLAGVLTTLIMIVLK